MTTASVQPASSSRSSQQLLPVQELFVSVADRAWHQRLMQPSNAFPPLIGTQSYDFKAKMEEAKRLEVFDAPEALNLFSEIIEKALLPGCPAEFAPGSIFFVNCLVYEFESFDSTDIREDYNFINARIEDLLFKTNLQDPNAINNIIDSLLSYLEQLAQSQYLVEEDFVDLKKEVEDAREKASLPNQNIEVQPAPKSREVSPEPPNEKGSKIRDIFAVLAFIGLAVLAIALFKRHVVRFKSLYK